MGYGDYCAYDGEPGSFYTEKRTKARKSHRCCELGIEIQRGEHYWKCTCGGDGTVFGYKQSETAFRLCRYINIALIGECSMPFGGLREWVQMFVDDKAPGSQALNQLVTEAMQSGFRFDSPQSIVDRLTDIDPAMSWPKPVEDPQGVPRCLNP